jgi:hypothetical protein
MICGSNFTEMDELIMTYRGLDLIRATPEHVEDFVPNLSDENLEEFDRLYGLDPEESIKNLIDNTSEVYSVVKDGEVLAMTGLAPANGGNIMWALFSNQLRRHWISFARASHKLIQYFHIYHPVLYCEVWAKSTTIHVWLCSLGFEPRARFFTEGADEEQLEVIQFVHCQQPTLNAFTESPRPVAH